MTVREVNFLSVVEVAGILRVSKMTVYRLINNGELKSNRFGRTFRIEAGDLEKYLQGSMVDPGSMPWTEAPDAEPPEEIEDEV